MIDGFICMKRFLLRARRLRLLAHLRGAYAIPLALSRRELFRRVVVCVHHKLPEIIKLSNPYLVQMFIMFPGLCLLGFWWRPPTLVKKIMAQKTKLFTFSTSSQKPPAVGTSYYAWKIP